MPIRVIIKTYKNGKKYLFSHLNTGRFIHFPAKGGDTYTYEFPGEITAYKLPSKLPSHRGARTSLLPRHR